MGILNTAFRALWYATHPEARRALKSARATKPVIVRGFKAGEISRLTESWKLNDASINAELLLSLQLMRARSRELFANNEYAKKFAILVKTNVVGPTGLTFRNRGRHRITGEIDVQDNARIQERFADFSKRGRFDVTGRLSRTMAEQLAIETMARDGEYLALKKTNPDYPHGFALQFLDVDRLDITKNEARNPRTGRRIIMGVEVDDDYRPWAYHILSQHPHGAPYDSRRVERVVMPAEMVIHDFIPMRPEQVRGVPWLHAAMVGLWDLGGYRESAIVNARLNANKVGYVKAPQGPDPTGGGLATDEDDYGGLLHDSEPGEYVVLPEDVEIGAVDTNYPHQMFADFNKDILRGIAAAGGVAYHSLTGDMESVNFATGKIGQMPERDLWMALQEMFASGFGDAYYPDWLRTQLARGELAPIQLDSFESNNAATWRGRRWQTAEPLKEAQANAANIANRVDSPRRVLEQKGIDPEEEWTQQAEDEEFMRSLGLSLPAGLAGAKETPDDDDGNAAAGADADGDARPDRAARTEEGRGAQPRRRTRRAKRNRRRGADGRTGVLQ